MSTIRAIGLGAISGLRSMSGPASVARAARDGRIDLDGTRLSSLASPRVATVLTILQAGEVVGDKLPFAPGRTTLPPLLGRAGAGALVGAAVSDDGGDPVGALLAAASAVAAAFAGERLRAAVVAKTGAPDILAAVGEDIVVFSVAAALLRKD